ncbi:MAG: outer rane receptor protein [Hydrocarboniphaga sp.]|nr:outer rane receptor protein [Hydrocarboniphaga sp.]
MVTAQKRVENIQDVPLSVTAFSADSLDAAGVGNVQDLQKVVPGLNYGGTGGYAVVFIRGLGTDAFLFADPSVALYVDGVYFPFSRGTAQSFGAVERVEVLKGPQGTLFGRNAVGGAINVITKDPGPVAETSIQTSYGKYDQSYSRIYTSIPVLDSVAVSLSAYYNTEENYYSGSINNGQPLPREESKGVRLKLKWSPADNVDLVLSGQITEGSGTGTMLEVNNESFPLGTALGITPQKPYHADLDGGVFSTLFDRAYYGRLESRFEEFDLKLLGSYEYVTTGGLFDFDGSPRPIANFSNDINNLYTRARSGELQVTSNANSWSSSWLKWIGGLYYFHNIGAQSPATFDIGNLSALVSDPAILQQLNISLPSTAANIDIYGALKTNAYAGFVQTTVSFTDWLSLTLGGRYSDETRSVEYSYNQVTLAGLPPDPLLTFPTASVSTRSFAPKVSVEVRPATDILFYASWQKAVKNGTFNVLTLYTPPSEVKPETVKAYEVGAKTTLLNGLVRFNAASFYYDDRNLQVQFVSLLNKGAVSFENAAAAKIYGIDADAVVQLFPDLLDDVVITASAEYLHARYTDYTGASQFSPTTGIYNRNGNFDGNQIVRSPTYSGNVGISKTFNLDSGSLELATDVYFTSRYFFLSQNSPISQQDSYRLFNAHVSYLYQRWNTRLTLFGQNLANAEYSLGPLFTDFGRLDHLAAPRTYGLRVNVDF